MTKETRYFSLVVLSSSALLPRVRKTTTAFLSSLLFLVVLSLGVRVLPILFSFSVVFPLRRIRLLLLLLLLLLEIFVFVWPKRR